MKLAIEEAKLAQSRGEVPVGAVIINPQRELRGVIQGVGDVVSHNRPEVVEIEELYTGRLIFLD